MKYLIPFLITFSVQAEPKLTEFYIEAEKAVMSNRSFNQVEGETVGGWLNLGYKIEHGFIYTTSKLTSEYSNRQFRYVSFDSELGINLTPNYQIFYRHYSGHMLDSNYGIKYPEENSVGIRFNIVGEK